MLPGSILYQEFELMLLLSYIQVGMATNIPPHNLGELVDALSVMIHNPEATVCSTLQVANILDNHPLVRSLMQYYDV